MSNKQHHISRKCIFTDANHQRYIKKHKKVVGTKQELGVPPKLRTSANSECAMETLGYLKNGEGYILAKAKISLIFRFFLSQPPWYL